MPETTRPWGTLREPRIGIMLHYDASASDAGALAWLRSPTVGVSYNWLVLDTGEVEEIAPPDARAWHAGVCRSSDPALHYTDANSAFYGVSVAARPPDRVTPAQFAAVIELCRRLYVQHGWPLVETYRIVGHNTEAWPPGRKSDPEGPDGVHPVLSVEAVRAALAVP